jgi:hypothetical protein
MNPELEGLAAVAKKTLPSYKPTGFTVRNAAEEQLLRSAVNDIANAKVISSGMATATWNIEKRSNGIPNAVQARMIYARYSNLDDGYCRIIHVNVVQDYLAAGHTPTAKRDLSSQTGRLSVIESASIHRFREQRIARKPGFVFEEVIPFPIRRAARSYVIGGSAWRLNRNRAAVQRAIDQLILRLRSVKILFDVYTLTFKEFSHQIGAGGEWRQQRCRNEDADRCHITCRSWQIRRVFSWELSCADWAWPSPGEPYLAAFLTRRMCSRVLSLLVITSGFFAAGSSWRHWLSLIHYPMRAASVV